MARCQGTHERIPFLIITIAAAIYINFRRGHAMNQSLVKIFEPKFSQDKR